MRNMKILSVAVALACATLAQAQSYPNKPIRTVLTVAGGVEVAVRALSGKVAETIGQPVIIDPQSAAGGAVGASMVARAAPDGYTVAYATTSAIVMRPFLTKNTPYDTLKDFTHITQVGEAVACVLVNNSVPVKNIRELVDYARAHPGKISYGTSGIGTTHHLSGEMLQHTTGIKIVHVPYKSGGQSFQDLVSGQVQLLFGVLASSVGFVESGKVRILAINGGARYAKMPDVPTVVELVPGYDRPAGWMGYLGPAGMPDAITRRLHAEIVKGMQTKEVQSVFDKLGLLVETSQSPEQFTADIRKQLESTRRIVKIAGIDPE